MLTTILETPRSPSILREEIDEASQARAARILSSDVDFLIGIPYDGLTEESLQLQRYNAASRLEAAEEWRLFRQMNLARFRAARLRQTLSRETPETSMLDEIERLLGRADRIRNQLAIVFAKLTVSIARRFANARTPLDELVSEGQATLLAAISKFDPERGFRFSTYATHALRRRLLRYLRNCQRERERFGELPQDHLLSDGHRWTLAYERRLLATLEQVERLLGHLPPRDRYILRSRYGWGREFDPRTLQDIADELGVSRERVRQLEARSLKRLRELAGDVEIF